MCVRRVGAVGLGGKHPDDSGIPTRSPVGVALSRARPPSALPARRPRPPHAPTERPPTVIVSCMRPTAGARPNHNDHKCSHTEYSTSQSRSRNATQSRADSPKDLRSPDPGWAPTRACAPRPTRRDRTKVQEMRKSHGKSLTAGHYSTKDHLRDLPKTELNHKSRLPHGNVLERGFTVARGAKRCPCSSVVHLR